MTGLPADVLSDYEDCMTQVQLESEVSPPPSIIEEEKANSGFKSSSSLIPKEEEVSAHGTVAWKVYSRYFSAVGYCMTLMILLSVVFMQISRNSSDWWLAVWVTHETNFNVSSGM